MQGEKSFATMANILTGTNMWRNSVKVTAEKLADWRKKWIFDAVAGKRLGQSFCEYFGVPNGSPLYHFKDPKTCAHWIKRNYLEEAVEGEVS